jgi:hypothetical protein
MFRTIDRVSVVTGRSTLILLGELEFCLSEFRKSYAVYECEL